MNTSRPARKNRYHEVSNAMATSRLIEAAARLSELLTAHDIKHGIFGGLAVSACGGARESKDVDCLVIARREAVIEILEATGREFLFIPQVRADHANFFWTKHKQSVLVELFPSMLMLRLSDSARMLLLIRK